MSCRLAASRRVLRLNSVPKATTRTDVFDGERAGRCRAIEASRPLRLLTWSMTSGQRSCERRRRHRPASGDDGRTGATALSRERARRLAVRMSTVTAQPHVVGGRSVRCGRRRPAALVASDGGDGAGATLGPPRAAQAPRRRTRSAAPLPSAPGTAARRACAPARPTASAPAASAPRPTTPARARAATPLRLRAARRSAARRRRCAAAAARASAPPARRRTAAGRRRLRPHPTSPP